MERFKTSENPGDMPGRFSLPDMAETTRRLEEMRRLTLEQPATGDG